MNHLFKKLVVVLLFINGFMAQSQNLTISSNGEGGTFGANWNITGTTLTVSGTATIQASVIETALASGNLLIVGNTSNLVVAINETINVTSGGNSINIGTNTNTGAISILQAITVNGDLTLYGSNIAINGNISTQGDFYVRSTTYIDQANSISTTTNGGDIIYWAGGSGESYIRPGTLVTNGGHVYMGGDFDAVGTRIWHGHTVGGGYAFSASFAGVALRGNIDTRVTNNQTVGGDVYIAGESGQSTLGDVAAESANRTISAGNGNITLLPFSEMLQTNGSLQMILETTGKISIAPVSGKSFWSGQTRTYNGSMSGTTFNGSSALAGIQIPNFANIGGWELGTWSGSGLIGDSPYDDKNIKNMRLDVGFTVAGAIRVKGDALLITQNLQSTGSGAEIRLKSDGPGTGNDEGWISLQADLTTNGGDIILWSNAANRNSGTANNEIIFNGNNTLTSNGGKIVLAGGMDDGSNSGIANDGIPDGFAYRGGNNGSAIGIRNDVNLLSGNGDVIIRGHSNPSGVSGSYNGALRGFGVETDNGFVINSGIGTINIKGLSNSDHAVWFDDGNVAITSASTATNAIVIDGESTINFCGFGVGFNAGSAASLIQTTGASGGNITINSRSNGASNSIWLGNNDPSSTLQILSNTGDISISSSDVLYIANQNLYLGNRKDATPVRGVTPVPTSASGNITLKFNALSFFNTHGISLGSTGALVVEPYINSFSNALSWPITNFNFASGLTGLRLGKELNTANITINTSQTIAGPISVYGGNITLNGNLNTAGGAAGDILLKASGNITQANSVDITTDGGDVIYWADSDENNNGNIYFGNSGGQDIVTNGGDVYLAGGAGTTVPTGYAHGSTAARGVSLPMNTTRGIINTSKSGGTAGDIFIRGKSSGSFDGIYTENFQLFGHNITLDGETSTGSSSYFAVRLGSSNVYNGSNLSQVLDADNDLTITAVNTAASYAGNAIRTGVNPRLYAEGNFTLNTSGKLEYTSNQSFININPTKTLSVNFDGTATFTTFLGDPTPSTPQGGLVIQSYQQNSFTSAFNSSTWFLNSNLSLLTIGKPTNTSNITFGSTTSIAGPITAYGGTITLDANLTTTNNGDISLFTDNPLGGLTTARTLTAAGAFKYIPRTTTFSADVTYPITNLTATSTGLTIGNATNDKNITINADVSGGAGIELYGNNVNINSNLTTTGTSAIMYLKGNTTIAAGKTITSGGNFTHDGNLTFKSDVNGTAAFGTLGGQFNKVSGITTVERYVPAKRAWRLLTAPLKGSANTTVPNNWQGVDGEGLLLFSPATYQNQTMTGYTTGGGMPNIWKYNSTNNTWLSIPNITDENLFTSTVNNGFLVFATGASNSTNIASGADITTLKPKGDLISGDVTHALTADKYHLIGNPYASPLNTVTLAASNTGSKIWLVDPTLNTVGGYFAYDGTNWAPTTPSGSDAYIQSGQGFFVRNTANATFTLSESHKVIGNSNTWFAKTENTETTESADKIRVLLYKQINNEWQLADGILAVNSFSGNNEVDATDTGKMTNFNENIAFRNGDSNLSIEYRAIPTTETIQPIRLTGTNAQPYQIRVKAEHYSNSNLQPYLQDTQLGALTEIPTDGSELIVNFNGIAATAANPDARFSIVYPIPLSTNSPNELTVRVYPNPVDAGEFNLSLTDLNHPAKYTLTNILGQQVQEGTLDKIQNTVSVSTLQAGVYMIQIEQAHKKFVSKLIIK